MKPVANATTSSSDFDWTYPYPSRRRPVLGANVVATSQPLAAQAGLRMLADGGNAVDAALAAAIALTVVEPTNNGLGSDAFALVWHSGALHGLNASGRSPAAMTADRFEGLQRMPQTGWDSVTVPGAVSAWVTLAQRFGRLDFARLFEPAIGYARDGFLVSPIVADQWRLTAGLYDEFPEFAATFLPEGRPPRAGELFRSEDLARSLEAIAASAGEAFYAGELAERMVAHASAAGGCLSTEDLASHSAEWVTPIAGDSLGVRLHEIPPNTQGLAALIALGILENTPAGEHPVDSADGLHWQIEAMKLALADAGRYVSDAATMDMGVDALLDGGYLARRAGEIDPRRAGRPTFGAPGAGDTVYLCAADAEGNMVSFIQSNYFGFGSGIVVPGTGISMQNRASGFTLEPGHPNRVGGHKRPFHTIIPAFVTREGLPLMAFGVMGGPMQAQGHVQMVRRIFGAGQNPQAASDAPRWQVMEGATVGVEAGFEVATLAALAERGHQMSELPAIMFGGAQLIYRLEGGYLAASDHRKDGQAVAF